MCGVSEGVQEDRGLIASSALSRLPGELFLESVEVMTGWVEAESEAPSETAGLRSACNCLGTSGVFE
jgi:hypothetical protein